MYFLGRLVGPIFAFVTGTLLVIAQQQSIDTTISVKDALATITSLVAQSTVTNEYKISKQGVIEEFGGGKWHYEYIFNKMHYVQPIALSHSHLYEVAFARTFFRDYDTAQRLTAAVNRMIWEYSPERRQQQHTEFESALASWRAAPVKPAMPDGAHTHQVLAENAVREKDFDKAMDEYEAALEIFPTWPDGQNNLAFLCGETGDYDCAIEHAQDYLELVPDASDAQAVKDKIIVWQDKLKGGGN